MREIEKSGRTVEEAIELALIDLDLQESEIEYEVLERESKGLFGIFGAKDARVRVWKKETQAVEEKAPVVKEKKVEEPVKPVEVKEEIHEEKVEAPVQDAELEGRVKNYLLQVTKHMGIDCDVQFTPEENQLCCELKGEDMALLIGKRGKTLDALQYLTNLAVNGKDNYTHVLLDTENYREKRKQALEDLAYRMADKAKKQRRDIMLNPMNAYERRIVHSALAKDRRVSTRSEGQDPYRKIIIFLNR
ncbi:RNA-binding cell elongation regulator Jag/EloR [Guggenheimella bovis]